MDGLWTGHRQDRDSDHETNQRTSFHNADIRCRFHLRSQEMTSECQEMLSRGVPSTKGRGCDEGLETSPIENSLSFCVTNHQLLVFLTRVLCTLTKIPLTPAWL